MNANVHHSQKSALVVDDSKLARYVLKEMLVEQGIKVDTAESAEEALGILSADKPDVIFMDHMMPGMDGFQAVQAIKSDPSTAKIPILMYTSKDGGVYVNQARALGAVGVLPKKLKPVQLERVLQQLKLIPFVNNISVKSSTAASESVHAVKSEVSQAQTEIITETRHTLEELSRSASEDLEKDSMRQLFRQLFLEQRDSIKQDQNELLSSMVEEVRPAVTQLSEQTVNWQKWGLGLTFTILVCVLGLWLSTDESIAPKIDQLAQAQQVSNKKTDQLLTKISSSTTMPSMDIEIIFPTQSLQWALNQNNQIGYQEPLTSLRLQNHMSELLIRLEQENFNGTLSLRYHSANYCEKNSSGEFKLANSKMPISQCVKRSDLEWGDVSQIKNWMQLVEQWSSAYSEFDIEFEYMGSSYTKQDYPTIIASSTNATLAQDWNIAAMANHRLEFNFYE